MCVFASWMEIIFFLTVLNWRLHSYAYILFSVVMIPYSFDWKNLISALGGSVDSFDRMSLCDCFNAVKLFYGLPLPFRIPFIV